MGRLLQLIVAPFSYLAGKWYESSVRNALPLLFMEWQGGRITARHTGRINSVVDVECRGLRLEFRFHMDEVHVHVAPDHSPREFLDLYQVLAVMDGARRRSRPFTSLQEVAGMFLPRIELVREALSAANFPKMRNSVASDWKVLPWPGTNAQIRARPGSPHAAIHEILKLMLALALAAAALFAADFRAAAVKVDITPKNTQWLMGYGARQSTGVLDNLYHRILALDDGKGTQVFLIASDLCVYSPSVYDDFTRELAKETGIQPRQVWWTVTHTHSSPELGPPGVYDVLLKGRSDHPWDREYLVLVTQALKRGILEARAKLAPARVFSGVGFSRANINRRSRDVDGTISLGLNPDGVVDTQLGLLRVEPAAGGKPIALVANYAMHGTVLGGRSLVVSGDGPGIVADYVEKKTDSIMLFVNSAAGNLAPIYSVIDSARGRQLGEFRVLLGDRVLETNGKLTQPLGSFALGLEEIAVETARREGLGWPPDLSTYAAGDTGVKIPVRILRMGDTVMWGAPVELFCEIAMRVRKESGYAKTFFFGYANGWLGYLPTAVAFQEGGYEPRTSPFTPRVEKDFGDAVVKAIRQKRKGIGLAIRH